MNEELERKLLVQRVKSAVRPTQVKTTRGALVIVPAQGAKKEIEFQYNPQSFKIDLKSQLYSSKDGRKPTASAPTQSMSVTIQLEATQGPVKDRPKQGVRAKLAELELLLYPSLDTVKKNKDLLDQGKIQAVPEQPPLILFRYGSRPLIPVRLTGLDVEEQIHDGNLNPVVAQVTLQMEVVTYSDVPASDAHSAKFLAYHQDLQKAAKP